MISWLFSLAVASTVETGKLMVPIVKPEVLKINTELFTKRPAEKRDKNVAKVDLPLAADEEGFSLREKQEMKIGDLFKAVIMNPKTYEVFTESNVLQVKE